VVLDIVAKLHGEKPRASHRTTIEHAGFFTEAQAARLGELGCLVSANPWYHHVLADKYSTVGLGPARAEAMSPLGLLPPAGVPVALHSDFTMAPAEPLALVWAAVTRVTAESGTCNRPEFRLDAYTALRGAVLAAA
jgi:predicted amidohydrolase YtcJ